MKNFFHVLEKFNAKLCQWCNTLVGVLMGVIAIIMFSAVVLRYVVNSPIPWSEDMTGFFLVWLVLLGAAPAMRNKLHVSIDLVVDKLPVKLQVISRLLSLLIICFVIWIMVYYGFPFAFKAMNRVMPSLEWLKFGYAYLALPIGYSLMLPICLELFINDYVTIKQLITSSRARNI